MKIEKQHPASHLFTVRLWTESLDNDLSEVRCQVRHVMSNETRHFRNWSELEAYLQNKLQELDRSETENS